MSTLFACKSLKETVVLIYTRRPEILTICSCDHKFSIVSNPVLMSSAVALLCNTSMHFDGDRRMVSQHLSSAIHFVRQISLNLLYVDLLKR